MLIINQPILFVSPAQSATSFIFTFVLSFNNELQAVFTLPLW